MTRICELDLNWGVRVRYRYVFLLIGSLVAAGLFLACQAGDDSGRQRFMSLGTAGTGGIYYPLGGALAGLLSVEDTLRQYTAEVTGGSVENLNRLREGQIDLGFSLAVSIYESFHGGLEESRSGPYQNEPFQALRIVAPLYPNVVHLLVPRGSGASSLADLRGERISVGSAGSGTEQISRQLLDVYGMSYEDVDERFLTFSESSSALRDGAVDGAILSVGYPAAAVLEATTTGGARLLSLEGDQIQELRRRHPYYSRGVIPPGVYSGVDGEVETVAMLNWIVGREDLEGEVVAILLDILEEKEEDLEQVHEMAGQIDLDALRDAPIPLHPSTLAWMGGRDGKVGGSG